MTQIPSFGITRRNFLQIPFASVAAFLFSNNLLAG
jgi:hypothetical protein